MLSAEVGALLAAGAMGIWKGDVSIRDGVNERQNSKISGAWPVIGG
jgi:hypothetical protein